MSPCFSCDMRPLNSSMRRQTLPITSGMSSLDEFDQLRQNEVHLVGL